MKPYATHYIVIFNRSCYVERFPLYQWFIPLDTGTCVTVSVKQNMIDLFIACIIFQLDWLASALSSKTLTLRVQRFYDGDTGKKSSR